MKPLLDAVTERINKSEIIVFFKTAKLSVLRQFSSIMIKEYPSNILIYSNHF